MNEPTKQRMQYVIDKFKTILPLVKRDEQFNVGVHIVSKTSITYPHKCGTVHCVGGWYAVANRRRKLIREKIKTGYCGYSEGSNLMANDLGFDGEFELEDWARVNHEKWGNIYGMGMFVSIEAYDGAKNMKEVVSFLEKVGGRLQ